MIVTLVVLLVLCPCLGLAGWGFYQAGKDDDKPVTPSTSAPALPTDEPSVEPTTAEPSPSETKDYSFVKGDCVVNDGTDADASLRKVKCGPGTYQVLLRIPGTTDGDKCKKAAPTATANYVSDNPLDSLDFVLCLKKRR
ncbi:hypothetical protein [Micromonospora sp. R77]|uniref:LppU/SCO3897 family protein n=1 Tax=Micromonospora sp. R77 TaxID=2925836 RepID=UPI0027DF50C0|nr:hypothetical protein [Micromonospora sp. R77]